MTEWWQDLDGLAGLIGGVAAIISAFRATSAARDSKTAAAQVQPNHGGSLADAINRIETAVDVVDAMTRAQVHQIGDLRNDLNALMKRTTTDLEDTNARLRHLYHVVDGWRT